MCPVIEGADLSSVSTKRPVWAEATYRTTIVKSEFDEQKKNLIIFHRLREPAGNQKAGDEYQDWLNIVTNAGERNEIGYQSLKKYFEALMPEHANDAPPNSDLLHGIDCKVMITSKDDKDGTPRNRIKKIMTD